MPKRPPGAFIFYCHKNERKVKEANPNIKQNDIRKLVGKMWLNLPES